MDLSIKEERLKVAVLHNGTEGQLAEEAVVACGFYCTHLVGESYLPCNPLINYSMVHTLVINKNLAILNITLALDLGCSKISTFS